MKLLVWVVAGLALVPVGPAAAGSCRSIEYAELKDMATADLVGLFCDFGALWEIEHRFIKGMQTIDDDVLRQYREQAMRGADTRWFEKDLEESKRKQDAALATMESCTDQRSKMRTAFKSRSLPEDPSCEAWEQHQSR